MIIRLSLLPCFKFFTSTVKGKKYFKLFPSCGLHLFESRLNLGLCS